jgi:hypothetical protein
VDNVGWYCSDITNSEGYILSNGTEINTLYCGDVGCNAEHTHCNFGFIGTYCEDSTHWIFSDINGVQNTGSCTALCVNITNGIKCLDNANITYECINDNGELVNCTSIETSLESTNIFINPANSLASMIGGAFGITDMGLSKNIASIIFSLISSLSIGVLLGHYGKIKGSGLMSIFFITNIMMLIVFTIISWFNPLIMVVLLIISGFIVVKTSGVFGGG